MGREEGEEGGEGKGKKERGGKREERGGARPPDILA